VGTARGLTRSPGYESGWGAKKTTEGRVKREGGGKDMKYGGLLIGTSRRAGGAGRGSVQGDLDSPPLLNRDRREPTLGVGAP